MLEQRLVEIGNELSLNKNALKKTEIDALWFEFFKTALGLFSFKNLHSHQLQDLSLEYDGIDNEVKNYAEKRLKSVFINEVSCICDRIDIFRLMRAQTLYFKWRNYKK